MLLTPEVLTLSILNVLFVIFATIAFVLSVKIYLNWDMNSTNQKQYQLEKYSFLNAIVIKYIFFIKIPLFLFFIFTLDKISNILTGAMCSAGVIDATEYGTYLIVLKILNLYLFAYWLKLHQQDKKDEKQLYTKLKFGIYIALYLFFMVEIALEGIMFYSIDINKLVSCCSSIYSSSSTSAISTIFSLNTKILLSIFYGNFFLIIIFYFFKNRYLFALSNIIFIVTALITLIAFFGTYIYELPSHHCPLCFLKSEYNYIGYLIYLLLFIGTFYGLSVALLKKSRKNYKISLIFNSLYVILLSLIIIVYYIKNGVLL
ncbi:MAG: hypothetical protein L3J10_06795 [Sulfurimonas sp.]|nr:hypothetical protein [Sulfurimonas sp.]